MSGTSVHSMQAYFFQPIGEVSFTVRSVASLSPFCLVEGGTARCEYGTLQGWSEHCVCWPRTIGGKFDASGGSRAFGHMSCINVSKRGSISSARTTAWISLVCAIAQWIACVARGAPLAVAIDRRFAQLVRLFYWIKKLVFLVFWRFGRLSS